MAQRNSSGLITLAAGAALCLAAFSVHAEVDVEAAKALARQNNCLKCHAIDKDKDGPSYKSVAEKFKGKAGAEARLIDHIMSGEKAKFPDGHEEEHKIVKTSPPKTWPRSRTWCSGSCRSKHTPRSTTFCWEKS